MVLMGAISMALTSRVNKNLKVKEKNRKKIKKKGFQYGFHENFDTMEEIKKLGNG